MIEPRWYQKDCLRAIQRARDKSLKEALVVKASGLGKTVTAAHDVLEFRKKHPDSRVLYLCHQTDILRQARTTFEVVNGTDHTYGSYFGKQKNPLKEKFLFATLQTMRGNLKYFTPTEFDYVAVDESHHVCADTYLDVVNYWKPKFLLGMTATPDRTDKQDICKVFGKPVYYLPIEEALAQDLLAPVDYRLLTDEIQLNRVIKTPERKLSVALLNRKVFIHKRDAEIARIIQKNIQGIQNPLMIVFCESKDYANHFAQFLPGSLPYHSGISSDERLVRFEMFRSGMVPTLLVVDCFNEGVDVPQANVIVFLRSTSSPVIFLQQLGRGLRIDESKDKVVVLDFVANCERIKTVYELWENVKKKRTELEKVRIPREPQKGTKARAQLEPFALNVDNVMFKERVVKLIDLVNRINTPFYKTWQEASQAAIALGIRTKEEYRDKYASVPGLPSSPFYTYRSDFPGWRVFLGGKNRNFYTYRKASKLVQKMGLKTSTQYLERRSEDERLPGDPPSAFKKSWQGWPAFLGEEVVEKCRTLKAAAQIALAAGVKTKEEYLLLCDKDKRLPRDPWTAFDNFPGWPKFLGRKSRQFKPNPYKTWQEAAQAAKKLGATTCILYQKLRKKDPRLYANPLRVYPDCSDWSTFLGNK